MAFPFLPLAIIGSAIISALSGGGKAQQTTTTTAPPRGYQSPMLGMLDPYMADMLIRNLKGWTSGTTFGGGTSSSSPYADAILSILGKNIPNLLAGYGTSGRTSLLPRQITKSALARG